MADTPHANPQGDGVADAAPLNWVDRYAPRAARPYLRLARWDRPIGTWLLLWPCWWGIALAAPYGGGFALLPWLYLPDPWMLVLFAVGAVAMRGAGCTYNDIVDRDFDAQVARTASRPLPSGQVGLKGAWTFLILQCLVGLAVLLQLGSFAILLGIGSLALVALYPFMKRLTYWPQLWLGLTFNWGALMGWAATSGSLGWPPLLLYAGAVFWTLGYDTIYAHQDKEDDALIGVKSTALRLGTASPVWIAGFYAAAVTLFAAAGAAAAIGWLYYVGLAFAGWHLARQVHRLDIRDPGLCLALFRSNRDTGAILFAAIVAGTLGSGIAPA